MKKEQKEKLEREARALYAQGMAMEKVAKTIQISPRTVYRWRKVYKWDTFKAQIDKKVDTKLQETVTEMKERHVQIVKATLARYIELLRSKDLHVSAGEATRMLQHELDLRIPRTISQFNFMQQNKATMNVEAEIDSAEFARQLFEKHYGSKGNSKESLG
jgi:transposase